MIDPDSYGPAMRALTEKQQRYVLAMLADPLGNPTAWARAAGYSDHMHRAKVSGHHLRHDPRVAAAVQEAARSAAFTLGPMVGLAVALQIAKDEAHPKRLQAAMALMDRGGLPAASEHTVNVNHSDRSGAALVERIRELAKVLGVDPSKLLGANAEPEMPKLIEGEVNVEQG